MSGEAIGLLEKLDGTGILVTFGIFIAVGFVAAYIDMYVVSKIETMAQIAPTQY